MSTRSPYQGRNREMLYRRLEGETFQSIADDYDLTRERVRQICRDELGHEVYYLALDGLTASQISKKLKIPYDHEAIRCCKRMGVL